MQQRNNSLRFGLLGPVRIVREGHSLPIERPRQRAVLAFLLLHANQPVSTDALIEAIWGGAAPATARAQIQADVSAIRRVLRQARLSELLRTAHAGYRVVVEPGQLDVDEFGQLVGDARTAMASGDATRAARQLDTALSLWRGPPLADVAAFYVEAARADLAEQRLAAQEDLAEAQLAAGRLADVVAGLTPLMREHPFRERACGLLMTALYRAGRQADALGVARTLRLALAEQHGLDPSERIRDLETRMLRADPSLDAAPVDAGPGAPVTSGALAPAQLPPAIVGFVDRDELLRRMDAIATSDRESAAPLMALTGPAGVGKTALAVRWAHSMLERFTDGQLYVNLHGYSASSALTPLGALARLLRALGLRPERVPLDLDEATAVYRTMLAGRRVVVVLDNCRDPQHVRPLLPGHRECVTIVTSRDLLSGLVAYDGAARVAVEVLAPSDSYKLVTNIVGAARTRGEAEATRELARLCGHLPLALRIAATRLADRPQQTIREDVERLDRDDRLVDLGIEGDGQASVTGAFDLSYSALPQPAQRMFRLLSVVPGADCTAPAVAELTATSVAETAPLLGRLVAVHLVDAVDADRYSMHDLLRLYAARQAAATDGAGELAGALARLLTYYLRSATAAVRLLYPQMLRLPLPDEFASGRPVLFDDPAAASAWLDAERANLVAAVRHAADTGSHRLAWLLADALRGYFFATMHTVEWSAVARAGLAAAELGGDHAGQAAAHMSLGGLYWRQGRHDEAMRHHTSSLALADAAQWPEAQAAILGNIGTVHAERGQLDEAERHFGQALEINQRLEWRQGQAVNHVNLGLVKRTSGRFEEAAEHYRLARDRYAQLGAVGGVAICMTNLGELLLALGQPAVAHEHLTEALALHRSVGDRGNEAETMRCLAAAARDTGRLAEALSLAEGAVDLAQQIGHARVEVEATSTVASVRQRMGEHGVAAERWQHALTLARVAENRFLQTEVLLELAGAARQLGRREEAIGYAREALALARQQGYPLLEQRALAAMAHDGHI